MVPTLGTSRIALAAAANVMVNRDKGNVEGSTGLSWRGSRSHRPGRSGRGTRRHSAGCDPPAAVNAGLSSFADAAGTIPWEYRSRAYVANPQVTRSFGWEEKHDFTAVGMSRAEP